MGDIRVLAKKFRSINIDTQLSDAIYQSEDVMIKLNHDQLQDGEYSDGAMLPEYSDVSVSVFGKPEGSWTLKETGDFYRGWVVVIKPNTIKLWSNEGKTGLILDKTDSDIFGLQPHNLTKYSRTEILPRLQKNISNYLKT